MRSAGIDSPELVPYFDFASFSKWRSLRRSCRLALYALIALPFCARAMLSFSRVQTGQQ
jgi:hypothetical protein